MTSEDERGRPRFRTRAKSVAAPKDAESLFGELPRTPRGVGALWSHQADHLRTYDRDHRTTKDVALELPTGSGKTLVGLLIADWRRRALRHRVVYACPTKQLARQVLRCAENQGIPVVLLIGPNSQWDLRQVTHYSAAEAVAVTVYSHIFNINSHLSDAQTLVFDDAHAAEGFLAEAWALTIDRNHLAYKDLFDALGANIDPHLVARMTGPVSSTSSGMEVRMIPVSSISHCIEDIDRLLAAELTGAAAWEFKMIRPSLKSCLFYVARSGWYVRPMIPPTFDHPPFTDPEQRIYLSATLGEAGELERAFGRFPIARVPSRQRGIGPAACAGSSSSLILPRRRATRLAESSGWLISALCLPRTMRALMISRNFCVFRLTRDLRSRTQRPAFSRFSMLPAEHCWRLIATMTWILQIMHAACS
jgi:RAD3-like DEAD/DEAH box helicase